MPEDVLLTEEELAAVLPTLSGWELREGWLRKKFNTPGWSHTMLLVNTIGYLAEAAYHHPDLSVAYAAVTVKLQTHRVHGITGHDIELARRIDEVVLWRPKPGDSLTGYPKKWVS